MCRPMKLDKTAFGPKCRDIWVSLIKYSGLARIDPQLAKLQQGVIQFSDNDKGHGANFKT